MSELRRTFIAEHLSAIDERIRNAELKAGRAPGSVELLPVTKYHPASDIEILKGLGIRKVGENREQEARAKAEHIDGVEFHMIGQIQGKKANSVARWASVVQSVDSLDIARKLNRGMAYAVERGDRISTTLPCYVQFSWDGDPHRGGIDRSHVQELVNLMVELEYLEVAGVMCVPPLHASASEVFAFQRKLTDSLSEQLKRPLVMSAGMTSDLEEAIQQGSDLVRVGTAILGPRPLA